MITSAKKYTKINIKIRNKSVTDSKPQVAPKVHCLSFGLIHFLFRYSTDARYIKLVVVIKSTAPEATRRNFPFSSLFAQLLGFSFGFGPTSACRSPSGICSSPNRATD